jgi:Mg-chelatase subunit ChlD
LIDVFVTFDGHVIFVVTHPFKFVHPGLKQYADDEPLDSILDIRQSRETSAPTAGDRIEVILRSEHPAVDACSVQPLTALVSIKAPRAAQPAAAAALPRPGIDIIMILDVSGSMAGQKIAQLRQTLLAATELLGPADRLSLIKFESSATRLTPLTRMSPSGRRAARDAVARLAAAGGTHIITALAEAAAVAEGRRTRNPVCGVLLLTDGKDASARAAHPPLVARLRATGATVSTFGYGRDHDAEILEGIAEGGRGAFTYVQRPDAVRPAFARCLGSLCSVAAQAARLDLHPLAGAIIVSVAATAAPNQAEPLPGGGVRVSLGELYRDESRDLLVELALPPAAAAALADSSDGGGPVYLEAQVTWAVPGEVEGDRCISAAQTVLRVRRASAAAVREIRAAASTDPAEVEGRSAVCRHRSRYVPVCFILLLNVLACYRFLFKSCYTPGCLLVCN